MGVPSLNNLAVDGTLNTNKQVNISVWFLLLLLNTIISFLMNKLSFSDIKEEEEEMDVDKKVDLSTVTTNGKQRAIVKPQVIMLMWSEYTWNFLQRHSDCMIKRTVMHMFCLYCSSWYIHNFVTKYIYHKVKYLKIFDVYICICYRYT